MYMIKSFVDNILSVNGGTQQPLGTILYKYTLVAAELQLYFLFYQIFLMGGFGQGKIEDQWQMRPHSRPHSPLIV